MKKLKIILFTLVSFIAFQTYANQLVEVEIPEGSDNYLVQYTVEDTFCTGGRIDDYVAIQSTSHQEAGQGQPVFIIGPVNHRLSLSHDHWKHQPGCQTKTHTYNVKIYTYPGTNILVELNGIFSKKSTKVSVTPIATPLHNVKPQ